MFAEEYRPRTGGFPYSGIDGKDALIGVFFNSRRRRTTIRYIGIHIGIW